MDITVLRLDVALPEPVAEALSAVAPAVDETADEGTDVDAAAPTEPEGGRGLRGTLKLAGLAVAALTVVGLFAAAAVWVVRRRRGDGDGDEVADADDATAGRDESTPDRAVAADDEGTAEAYQPRARVPDVDFAPVVGIAFLALLAATLRWLRRDDGGRDDGERDDSAASSRAATAE
ncbi:MAG: hypothetical protein ABEJ89_03405 [Haloarculaceae archaeon]